ncbi:MAG: APC family permease [Cellvibrionaceae bacterium]
MAQLRRTLSLSAMVFYGLGTIIGAGIYVLIGEIAGQAGAWTPLSFVVAALIASFTGLSYAELVSRFPRSAGEAVYVEHAFNQVWLTQLVGWSVILTGLVSAATLLKGFSGYFIDLFGYTELTVISFSVLFICLLACSGVKQSVGLAVMITLLEIAGLILVVIASTNALSSEARWQNWYADLEYFSFSGISAAAFLAFYAFIGFEDMVNMAEEVKDPSTNLPKAIIIALIASTLIYFIIATVAVVSVPTTLLASSSAPLTVITQQSSWFPSVLISLISLIAILNGAIVQLLMAPRVIYGITKNSIHLRFLSSINKHTQTPVIATITTSILVLIFTLLLPLSTLAQLTSGIILVLFILINLALLSIKLKQDYDGFKVKIWVPIVGIITSGLLLLTSLFI